jgi:hypothetical protein
MGQAIEAALELSGLRMPQAPQAQPSPPQRHAEHVDFHFPENRSGPAVTDDPMDLLPKSAREKFNLLMIDSKAAQGASRTINEERDYQHRRILNFKSNIESGQHSEAAKLRAELQRAQDDFVPLSRRAAEATERRETTGQLAHQIKTFVEDLHSVRVIAVEPPTPKKPPTDFVVAVEDRRRYLRELQSKHRTAEVSELPSSDAKKLAREQIAGHAARGRPDLSALVEGRGGNISFRPGSGVGEKDAFSTLCWLFEDALIAKVEAELDSFCDDTAALSNQARIARLAEVAGDMLSVEREEENLIETAARNGVVIARRGDASVLAVLGIRLEEVKL